MSVDLSLTHWIPLGQHLLRTSNNLHQTYTNTWRLIEGMAFGQSLSFFNNTNTNKDRQREPDKRTEARRRLQTSIDKRPKQHTPWLLLLRWAMWTAIIVAIGEQLPRTKAASVVHSGRIWAEQPAQGGPVRLPTVYHVDNKAIDLGVWLDRGFTTTGQGAVHVKYDIRYRPLMKALIDIDSALHQLETIGNNQFQKIRGPSTAIIRAQRQRLFQLQTAIKSWSAMGLTQEEAQVVIKHEGGPARKISDRFLGEQGRRGKRGIVGAILGLIGAGVAIGFSVYNTAQIGQIQAALDGQKKGMDLIVHELADTEKRMDKYGESLYAVTNNVDRLNHMVIEVAALTANLELTEAAISAMEAHINTMDRVIEAARMNRLHQALFDPYAPAKLILEIEKKVKHMGHSVLPRTTTEFLQTPATGVAHRNGFRIIAHVATSSREDILNLFEFKAIPVLVQGHLLKVEPRETIIAINSAHTHFQTMSKSALERCTKVGRYALCGEENVVDYAVRPDNRDCLLDLYLNRPYVNESCPIAISEPKISVTHVEAGLSVLVSPKDTWASVSCGSKSASVNIDGATEVHLEPGCKVTASFGTVHRALDLNMTGEARTATWDMTQGNITGSLNLDAYKYIVEAAKALDMGPPPSHLNGTQAFVRNYEAVMEQTQYRNSSYGIIIAIGVTLLIFGTLMVCFYRKIGRIVARPGEGGEEMQDMGNSNRTNGATVEINMREPSAPPAVDREVNVFPWESQRVREWVEGRRAAVGLPNAHPMTGTSPS